MDRRTPSASSTALRALRRRADPTDAGAQNNLGVVLLARGQRDEAVAAFSRALALDPLMRLAERNLAVAADDQWAARRERELRARLRADAGDAEARRELARLHSARGRHDAARAEVDALLALLPDDPGALVQRALVEQSAGDLHAAENWLFRALAMEPDSALARAHLGEVLYHQGAHERALGALREAVALAPEFAEAHHVLAFVYGELGHREEARAAAERARALDPSLTRAAANLSVGANGAAVHVPAPAATDAERGDGSAHHAGPATPTATARDVAAAHSADPLEGHLALGAAFRHKGYFEEALREYRRARERAGDDARVLRALGELHVVRGAAAEARAVWERLTAMETEDADAWNGRGVAARLCGDVAEARACWDRALAVAPAHCAAHANVGVARWADGDAAGARAALERAVAVATHAVPPRLALAHVLAGSGDADGALAQLGAVLKADGRNALAWTGIGRVFAAAGRAGEARAAFARAVDAEPNDAAARYGLAFAAAAMGDHDEARRETELALAISPVVPAPALPLLLGAADAVPLPVADAAGLAGDHGVVAGFALDGAAADALLGEVLRPDAEAEPGVAPPAAGVPTPTFAVAEELLRAGLHERAVAAAHRALARGADRASGLTLLGDAFARQGFDGEALERWEEACTLPDAPRAARIGLARLRRALGRRAAAREAGEALTVAYPDDAEALALAAAARADDGELDGAVDALARATQSARGPLAWRTIADAWRAVGGDAALGSATDAYRHALAELPSALDLRLALARTLVARGDREAATRELRAVRAVAPDAAEAALELAALLRDDGAVREAARVLVDVLERDPHHLDALAQLAALLTDLGRDADAGVAARRVLRLDPEHALALCVEGELFARGGRGVEACDRWARGEALEPAGEAARRARRLRRALDRAAEAA